jgi:hypothetical protein
MVRLPPDMESPSARPTQPALRRTAEVAASVADESAAPRRPRCTRASPTASLLAGSTGMSLGWALGSGPTTLFVELLLERPVGCLQLEHGGYAGQVEPGLKEPADLAEPSQVRVAVATGPAGAAGWVEQAAGLVQAQVLRGAADQLGGDRDAIHRPAGVNGLVGRRS